MYEYQQFQNIIEEWILSQQDFFKNLPPLPDGLEDDLEELRVWNRKLMALYDNRDYYQRLWEERQETLARIEAIVERQIATTEQEIAEREFLRWKRELEKVKARIDSITGKIIREIEARRRMAEIQAERKAALEAAAHARKMKEDLRLWEAYKRTLSGPEPPTEAQKAQFPVPPPKQPIRDHDRAVWEAYIRGEKLPPEDDDPPPQKVTESPPLDLREELRRRMEEERIAREIAVLRNKETATQEENQAVWEAFIREMGEQ